MPLLHRTVTRNEPRPKVLFQRLPTGELALRQGASRPGRTIRHGRSHPGPTDHPVTARTSARPRPFGEHDSAAITQVVRRPPRFQHTHSPPDAKGQNPCRSRTVRRSTPTAANAPSTIGAGSATPTTPSHFPRTFAHFQKGSTDVSRLQIRNPVRQGASPTRA